ncbi:hypothetical protein [Sporosarcina jiandibaonis]|uniref:hypothetical protein n=1 Tax=Sporosarcina jiandibaonis TaxID=2715535 RepID=UPI001552569B|nr:hypothetical protein [Sporosarcina jiandibaonis]
MSKTECSSLFGDKTRERGGVHRYIRMLGVDFRQFCAHIRHFEQHIRAFDTQIRKIGPSICNNFNQKKEPIKDSFFEYYFLL